jgi:C4-type Zn-finger protein
MITMFDKRIKREYLENGNFCPFCQSKSITNIDYLDEYYDTYIIKIAECDNCKKKITKIFTLTDIEDYELTKLLEPIKF